MSLDEKVTKCREVKVIYSVCGRRSCDGACSKISVEHPR